MSRFCTSTRRSERVPTTRLDSRARKSVCIFFALSGIFLATDRMQAARTGDDWSRLTPDIIKAPVVVELTHNPCQPAVPESTRRLQQPRTVNDDPGVGLQTTLSKRLRSVVRGGHQPLVLIDNKLIRPGDSIPLMEEGQGTLWKLTLKEVHSDRLVWFIESTGVGPRDVVTWLDQFLRGI